MRRNIIKGLINSSGKWRLCSRLLTAKCEKESKALLRDPDIRVTDVADKHGVSRATLHQHEGVVAPVRTLPDGD